MIEVDFYILLVDWQEISSRSATFKVYHNPLVNWLWIGSWVFIVGTIVAAWPRNRLASVPQKTRKNVYQTSSTD